MICDFYGAASRDLAQANEWANALRADFRVYRAHLHAALAVLREAASDLPVAAIGFCMGGQAALELARDGADLALAASFHGLLDTSAPAKPGAVRTRILVCHGDADPLVPREQVLAFWEEDGPRAGELGTSTATAASGTASPIPTRRRTTRSSITTLAPIARAGWPCWDCSPRSSGSHLVAPVEHLQKAFPTSRIVPYCCL